MGLNSLGKTNVPPSNRRILLSILTLMFVVCLCLNLMAVTGAASLLF